MSIVRSTAHSSHFAQASVRVYLLVYDLYETDRHLSYNKKIANTYKSRVVDIWKGA